MVFTGATEDAEARSVIAGAKPACIGGTGTSRELELWRPARIESSRLKRSSAACSFEPLNQTRTTFPP